MQLPELALTMHAWEIIERRLCMLDTLADRLETITSAAGILQLCELIAILANAAAERDERPERLSGEDVIGGMEAGDIRPALEAVAAAIEAGMRTAETAKKPVAVDVTLAELDKRDGKHRVTWAIVSGYGLIAGVDLLSQRTQRPGDLIDWYHARQKYDDEQHGIRRRKKGA